MEDLRAFLFCRVLGNEARGLLDYQEEVLRKIVQRLNWKIVACSKEIGSGKSFDSWSMEKLIHYIVTENIDVILVYDKTRLCIYDDLYAEFKMLCEMHHVQILTMDQISFPHT